MKTEEFYEVIVFNSEEDMYTYYDNTGGYEEHCFYAICRPLYIYKDNILQSQIGEILITKELCKSGTIAHECGHAVFQYLRKLYEEKIWTYMDDKNKWNLEEMYCQILGSLNSQFVNQLYENKILP